ncbi:MAG: hypothetical protein AAGG44_21245 [Planctomycetota bacterium]
MDVISHRLLITTCIALAVLPLGGCNSSAQPTENPQALQVVTFPNGPVEFQMPTSYSLQLEPDETVAITPGDVRGITIRLNLHNLPSDMAAEFVEKQASDKGLEVTQVGDKTVFSETGIHSSGGRQYDMTFWQIGFGDALVVLSAEVDQSQSDPSVLTPIFEEISKITRSLEKRK